MYIVYVCREIKMQAMLVVVCRYDKMLSIRKQLTYFELERNELTKVESQLYIDDSI